MKQKKVLVASASALFGIIGVLGIGAGGGVAGAAAKKIPNITSVSFANYNGSSSDVTVTIKGRGFGTNPPPVVSAAACGGNDYGNYQLGLIDITEGSWSAGMTPNVPNCTGVTITSWSPNKIVYSFNPTVYPSTIQSGDAVVVFVKDAFYGLVLP